MSQNTSTEDDSLAQFWQENVLNNPENLAIFKQNQAANLAATKSASRSFAPSDDPSLTKPAPEKEYGVLDTIGDIGSGIVAGAWDGMAETVNMVSDGINLFRDDDNQIGNIMPTTENTIKVETGAGKIAKSIAQFAVGFIGAGKFLKAKNLLQGAGKAITIGRGMVQGAWADFSVFDGNEERLSNLIESIPMLANPITDFLAAKEDDPAALGRFKNVLEGMALGAAGEVLFSMVRGIKASRGAKTVAEAEDKIIKATDEIQAISDRTGQSPEELMEQVDAVASVTGDTKPLEDAVGQALENGSGKMELNVHGVDAEEAKAAIDSLAKEDVQLGFRHVDPETFISIKNKSARPEFLSEYKPEDMKDWRLFSTEDNVAFAIKPDGDIVNVVNNSGRKGAGQDAIVEAIAQGGKKLDCYDGFLTKNYKRFGFVETERHKWDVEYQPDGWNYEKYGEPDVVNLEYPEGLSRDRADVRRRFENTRSEESQGGRGIGSTSGGGGNAGDASGTRPGMGQAEQGTPGGRTGVSERLLADPAAAPSSAKTLDTPLTPEEMGKLTEKALASGEIRPEDVLNGEYLIGNSNRIKLDTPEEISLHAEFALKALDKTLKGKGIQTDKFVMANAQEYLNSIGYDELSAASIKDREYVKGLPHRIMAYKIAAQSNGKRLLNITQQAQLHGWTPELRHEFERASKLYQDLSLTSKDIATTSARITASGRASPVYMDPDALAVILKVADNDPEKVLRIITASRESGIKRLGNGFTEMVINGLLSSPKTHAINITGNFFKMLLMPAETMLGGVFTGNKQLIQQGAATYAGIARYISESWKAAKAAMKSGDNILDANHKIMESYKRPVLSSYSNLRERTIAQKLVDGAPADVGLTAWEEVRIRAMSFIGLPSRALLGMDEMFKQLNYRSKVYGQLTADGIQKFGKNTRELAEYVENGMREAFDSAGRATDENALRYAQEATWTQELKDDAYFNGGLGNAISTTMQQYAPLRLVTPFVRTPTNLIRDFVAHTPGLNMLTKRYKDAIKAGGERQARAYGQMATGALLWVSAINLAMEGKMTGGYPKDPATRQAWVDAGIEPYSFRIGDTYISFARLDPFATFFGIAADYAEYTRSWADSPKGNWASGAILALGNNILSKSYLTGITDVINALGDTSVDSNKMQRFLQRATVMSIPYSSGLRFTRQLADDNLREVRGGLDAILNTIPGTSSLLPPRRSWITGEPVSQNLFWGTHKDDVVADELARLGDNLSIGAPPHKLKAVELDGEQYSRLCELQGSLKIGGLTQHERLKRLMKSSSYDINRRRMPDMPGDEESPRTKMVEDIIRQYRTAAQKALLREDQSLKSSADIEFKKRLASRRGDVNQVKQLLSMPQRQ